MHFTIFTSLLLCVASAAGQQLHADDLLHFGCSDASSSAARCAYDAFLDCDSIGSLASDAAWRVHARSGAALSELNRTGFVVTLLGLHRRGPAEILESLSMSPSSPSSSVPHPGLRAPRPRGVSVAVVPGPNASVPATCYLDVSAQQQQQSPGAQNLTLPTTTDFGHSLSPLL